MRHLRKYSSSLAIAAGSIFLICGLLSWQISIATALLSVGIVLVVAGFARSQSNILRLLKRVSLDRKLMLGRFMKSEQSVNELLDHMASSDRLVQVIDHRTRSLLMNDKQFSIVMNLLDEQVQSGNKLVSQIDFRTRRIFENTSSKLIENGITETNQLISQIADSLESDLRASNVMRLASRDLHFTLGKGFENIVQELENLSVQLLAIDNQMHVNDENQKG